MQFDLILYTLLHIVWWIWEEEGDGQKLSGKIHTLLWALGNQSIGMDSWILSLSRFFWACTVLAYWSCTNIGSKRYGVWADGLGYVICYPVCCFFPLLLFVDTIIEYAYYISLFELLIIDKKMRLLIDSIDLYLLWGLSSTIFFIR